MAVVLAALIMVTLSYQLVHEDPGYAESGTVAFTAPKSSVAMFQNTAGLMAVEEAAAGYMAGPQAEQQVRAAGGTVPYNVSMLNSYNEEYPNYSLPYATILVTSPHPAAVEQTYDAVLNVFVGATEKVQQQAGASPSNEVKLTVITEPSGAIAEGGSNKRAYAGLGILSLIAIFLTAKLLDRRRRPVADAYVERNDVRNFA
jgi:hypothetical protein